MHRIEPWQYDGPLGLTSVVHPDAGGGECLQAGECAGSLPLRRRLPQSPLHAIEQTLTSVRSRNSRPLKIPGCKIVPVTPDEECGAEAQKVL